MKLVLSLLFIASTYCAAQGLLNEPIIAVTAPALTQQSGGILLSLTIVGARVGSIIRVKVGETNLPLVTAVLTRGATGTAIGTIPPSAGPVSISITAPNGTVTQIKLAQLLNGAVRINDQQIQVPVTSAFDFAAATTFAFGYRLLPLVQVGVQGNALIIPFVQTTDTAWTSLTVCQQGTCDTIPIRVGVAAQ